MASRILLLLLCGLVACSHPLSVLEPRVVDESYSLTTCPLAPEVGVHWRPQLARAESEGFDSGPQVSFSAPDFRALVLETGESTFQFRLYLTPQALSEAIELDASDGWRDFPEIRRMAVLWVKRHQLAVRPAHAFVESGALVFEPPVDMPSSFFVSYVRRELGCEPAT